jgi:omega-6 fatty acid desaturase (delta-12 desaturase)
MPSETKTWSPAMSMLFKIFRATPLKLWGTIWHWLVYHFDLNKYTEKQKPRVSHVRCERRTC